LFAASIPTKAPAVYDKVTGKKLVEKKDFTFLGYETEANDENVYMAKIKGIGNFASDSEIEVEGVHVYTNKITAKAVSVKTAYYYTGKAITPSEEDDFAGLKLGTDFEVVGYKGNIKAGKNAVVIVKGKGAYGGTANIKFTINKASAKSKN
jgi:hypothetical protein